MPGETDVVNVALIRIGASRITSLTDGSPSANAANDIYALTRDKLLRAHPWNFASKRVKLAQSSTDPTFEYDFAYPLPADWIRNVSVHDNDAGHGTIDFRTELNDTQRAIVTSVDAVYLRYVAQITDANLMAPDFRDALEFALARDLAIKLTSSNTLRDEMSTEATKAKAAARSSDAMGAPPERRPIGSWVTARGGRRNDIFRH